MVTFVLLERKLCVNDTHSLSGLGPLPRKCREISIKRKYDQALGTPLTPVWVGRVERVSVSSRPTWSSEPVPGQLGILRHCLKQNKTKANNKHRNKESHAVAIVNSLIRKESELFHCWQEFAQGLPYCPLPSDSCLVTPASCSSESLCSVKHQLSQVNNSGFLLSLVCK